VRQRQRRVSVAAEVPHAQLPPGVEHERQGALDNALVIDIFNSNNEVHNPAYEEWLQALQSALAQVGTVKAEFVFTFLSVRQDRSVLDANIPPTYRYEQFQTNSYNTIGGRPNERKTRLQNAAMLVYERDSFRGVDLLRELKKHDEDFDPYDYERVRPVSLAVKTVEYTPLSGGEWKNISDELVDVNGVRLSKKKAIINPKPVDKWGQLIPGVSNEDCFIHASNAFLHHKEVDSRKVSIESSYRRWENDILCPKLPVTLSDLDLIEEMNPELCWNVYTWNQEFRCLKALRIHDHVYDVASKKRREINLFLDDDHYSALVNIQRIIKINHGARCPRCFKNFHDSKRTKYGRVIEETKAAEELEKHLETCDAQIKTEYVFPDEGSCMTHSKHWTKHRKEAFIVADFEAVQAKLKGAEKLAKIQAEIANAQAILDEPSATEKQKDKAREKMRKQREKARMMHAGWEMLCNVDQKMHDYEKYDAHKTATSERVSRNKLASFGALSVNEVTGEIAYKQHVGKDAAREFVKYIKGEAIRLYDMIEFVPKEMDPNEEWGEPKECWICEKAFTEEDLKVWKGEQDKTKCAVDHKTKPVRDHDHRTGKKRGWSHNWCNMDFEKKLRKSMKTVPVFFHNLKGYDSHLLLEAISNMRQEGVHITAIPMNGEKVISFSMEFKHPDKKEWCKSVKTTGTKKGRKCMSTESNQKKEQLVEGRCVKWHGERSGEYCFDACGRSMVYDSETKTWSCDCFGGEKGYVCYHTKAAYELWCQQLH